MGPFFPVAVGALIGGRALKGTVPVPALIGASIGWFAWQRSQEVGWGGALSGLARRNFGIPGAPLGAIDPELLTSLIDAGVAVTGATASVVGQRQAAKQQAAAARQASRVAEAQARLAAAQAQQEAAAAARLRAQTAASPLSQPGVVLPLVALLGLGTIFLIRKGKRP